MGVYNTLVLPVLTHLVCSQSSISRQRMKIIPSASGNVLEVGMGSGLNLPFYHSGRISRLWGIEPSERLRRKAAASAETKGLNLEMVGRDGQSIPLADQCADTVVLTYALCTIPDPKAAVSEMYRVLKPGGKLLFCEHGCAPDVQVFKWQKKLSPYWQQVSGGCHLERPVSKLLCQGGFHIQEIETGYTSALKIVSYNYTGVAVK